MDDKEMLQKLEKVWTDMWNWSEGERGTVLDDAMTNVGECLGVLRTRLGIRLIPANDDALHCGG